MCVGDSESGLGLCACLNVIMTLFSECVVCGIVDKHVIHSGGHCVCSVVVKI